METVLFYYTLIVLLAVILTAATCLSSYLVSRQRTQLFLSILFIIYFFDVALVFQDDFLLRGGLTNNSTLYFIGQPVASIALGAGLFAAFLCLVCEFLSVKKKRFIIVPVCCFIVLCIAALVFIPAGNWQVFCFYSIRGIALAWTLGFLGVQYLSADEMKRNRMWRFRWLYAALWVLGTLVVLENVYFLLMIDHSALLSGLFPLFPERNFAENVLFLCCALFAFRNAFRLLCLRYKMPPADDREPIQGFIDQKIETYSTRYDISERESEVLRLILLGNDNREIASSLFLAISTVKAHVHHILQKTGLANRQELIRDFWRSS